ncbi:DUF3761 domain-containing protein [Rhodanobacter sp. MP1X3]|uniref:DUF3761 domain-containing protein n=1 Tax=Rhodanobacter sp. MP1X3 TaxID=2723086 RepID=UPI0031B8B0D1
MARPRSSSKAATLTARGIQSISRRTPYRAQCLPVRLLNAAMAATAPAGASAQCRDGSYSFSMNHRGTCSHHGGVARWL